MIRMDTADLILGGLALTTHPTRSLSLSDAISSKSRFCRELDQPYRILR